MFNNATFVGRQSSGSGTITGSGTPNQIVKFTGAQAIGDSNVSDDGTTVTVSSIAVFAPPVATSGTPTGILYTGASNTGLTASTEFNDIDINLKRTVQFATGAIGNQRAIVIQQPVYSFVGASVITNSATVYIEGAPVASTNATITNTYALWIDAGNIRFDGNLSIGTNGPPTAVATIGASTTARASINIASGTAPSSPADGDIWNDGNITFSTSGITIAQRASTSGNPTGLLFTGAAHTGLTASAELIDVNYNLARTVQRATGAVTTQRSFLIQAPTYSFVGASTITTAATFAVSGAPIVGTNATITNAYSIWSQSGSNFFTDGSAAPLILERTDDDNNAQSVLTLRRMRSSATAPGANFGGILGWSLEGFTNGSTVSAGNIRVLWEVAQTNDTTTRDSYMLFNVMANNAAVSALRINSNAMTFFGANTDATAFVHISAGSTAGAPLRFTSGPLTTGANVLAGNVEFLTDKFYGTISTGPTAKEITLNDIALTSGRVPFITTNGRLTDDADMTFATDTLTVAKIVGSTSVKVGAVAGFISSDGSPGATGTITAATIATVKDGIVTAIV